MDGKELLPQSFLPFNIVQRGRSTRMHRNLLNCILGMLIIGFSSLRHRMAGPLCKKKQGYIQMPVLGLGFIVLLCTG